jgi:hypothetical protein
MVDTAQEFYPRTTAVTGEGGTDIRELDPAEGASVDTTKCNFGTTTASGNIVCRPFVSHNNRAAIAANSGYGWDIPRADMGSTATAKRFIPAGDWLATVSISADAADATPQTRVTCIVERVSSSNGITELFRGDTGLFSVALAETSQIIPMNGQSQVVLEADETIRLEFWITGQGVAVVGRIITFSVGPSGPLSDQHPSLTVPSPGIRTQYPRSPAETITSSSDSVARVFAGTRRPTETITSASDSVARAFTGSRNPTETITAASDSVSRAGSGFRRALAETVPAPTDAVTRIYGAVRVPTETITSASDSVARIFTGARNPTETITSASDVVTRTYGGVRAVSETVDSATDVVTRIAQFNRALSETINTLTDSVARELVLVRAVSETVPSASDSVTRVYGGVREITEDIGPQVSSVQIAPDLIFYRGRVGIKVADPNLYQ